MIIESKEHGILQLPEGSFFVAKESAEQYNKQTKQMSKSFCIVFLMAAAKVIWPYPDESERDRIFNNIHKVLKPLSVD